MSDRRSEAGTLDAGARGELLSFWEGEPVHVWEALWGVPGLECWTSLGSTNDRARQLARGGALPFTVVIAEEQTAGRGRGGRPWSSPSGLGLWISVLLRPPVPAASRLVPLLVGLATCRALERSVDGVTATLKWPNDVLLGERKVAGVLCEGGGEDALVAGVGINVRQSLSDFPGGLRGRAVSVEMATGRAPSRARLAGALLAEMRTLVARPPLRLEGAELEEVARRDALYGAHVAVDGIPPGRASGIDERGRLAVEVAPGDVRKVVAGTVVVRP